MDPHKAHRIPEKIQAPDGTIILLVPDGEFDSLIPPQGMNLPISGFMDRQGSIHYEINALPWRVPRGWGKLALLFNMKKFYQSIPGRICETCITKDPQELIGGGPVVFYGKEKRVYLSYLGLRPRAELPDITKEFRKKAIFRFQESYNQLVQWLGATRTTTITAIIPDEKMRALGWQPIPLSFFEYLRALKDGFPASLTGKIRAYEIKF